MTAAICTKCGHMKIGAWTSCEKCGFTPASSEDKARAILLSDHNLDLAKLKETGERICQGISPTFDEASIAEMAAEFEAMEEQPPPGRLGCLIYQWILIGLAIALLIGVICTFWYLKRGP